MLAPLGLLVLAGCTQPESADASRWQMEKTFPEGAIAEQVAIGDAEGRAVVVEAVAGNAFKAGSAFAESHDGSGSLIIRCGMLIDGLLDHPRFQQEVVILDGRIAAVRPIADSLPIEHSGHGASIDERRREIQDDGESLRDLPVLNARDQTCLPGLINTHVHFDANPEDAADYSVYATRTEEDVLALALANAKTTLLSGFTTVRHTGAWFPSTIDRLKRLIEVGAAPGPRIQTAGPYLTIPGGGGDLRFPEIPEEQIPADSQRGIATTPEEFADRTRAAIDAGADFLKVIASGAVFSMGTEPGAPEMTREDIEAVVQVAHEAGLKVTAHVHSDQSGQDAILAGVDSLEHASLLKDMTIALAVERGVAFSMDVYNGTYTDTVGREQGYPATFLQRNADTTEAQREVFEKAYRAGVPLLYGTDAGVLPHEMGAWQFDIMVERGMTPMAAIKSATSIAALYMELEADVGALVPGRYGDLVLVSGDPLTNINTLRRVRGVVKGGIVTGGIVTGVGTERR
jgi:imidazolonepropionase-like amidohydrolase